jgi:hypothetical protein
MSVQNLKLKVLTKFPATVTVGSGLTLTNINGVYTFTLGGALGAIGALPTAGAKTVLAGGGGAPSWSASPTVAGLTVSANAGASLPAAPTGTALQVAGADGANVFSTYDAFGGAGNSTGTQFRKARGTAAAPTALQTDDPIGGTYAFGYGATGYSASQRGFAGWFAGENWTDTAQGTYYSVYVVNATTLVSAERLRISGNGSVRLSGYASGFLKSDSSGNISATNVTQTAPQGRLTLTSGVARPTSDVSGATTIFYTPSAGDAVPIYDGTSLVPTTFAELSNITTNSATGKAGPAAVTTNSNYDLFVWNDAGTVRLTRGPAWTSDTARGAGAGTTELQIVKGIQTNKQAITNGPGANLGTYVGTVRSNGTSTIDFTFGTDAAGGGAAILGVWNLYNQCQFSTAVGDSTASWTYSTATTRSMDNNVGNRVSFVSGLPIHSIAVMRGFWASLPATVGAFGFVGFGLDSTSAFTNSQIVFTNAAAALTDSGTFNDLIAAQTGFHFIQALERGDGTNTTTFAGSAQTKRLVVQAWH